MPERKGITNALLDIFSRPEVQGLAETYGRQMIGQEQAGRRTGQMALNGGRGIVNALLEAGRIPGDVYAGDRPANVENAMPLLGLIAGGNFPVAAVGNGARLGAMGGKIGRSGPATAEPGSVKQIADIVAAEFNVPVIHSRGAGGASSYLRFGSGDVRISDHGMGSRRTDMEGPGYMVSEGADAIIASIRESLARGAAKAEAERVAARRAAEERRARNAPIVAEHAANRAAKMEFFAANGLEDATETARNKAWKAYLREQRAGRP